MRRLFAVFMMMLAAWAMPHSASALTPAEEAEVERLRVYLNNLTTLKASFQQSDGRGNLATGRFWLHRPNRLRFEYDPPNPILIIARGSFLVHFDKELKEAHYLDQNDTPAWFLLAEEVQFGENVIVDSVMRTGNRVSVTARQRNRPDEGAITLNFNHTPIRLLGWSMIDGGGSQTYLTLLDQTVGGEIDQDLFDFRPTDYD